MKKQVKLPEPIAGRVRLDVRYGPDVVAGVILGPLAIHRSVDPFNDGFSVTHVPTGSCVPYPSTLTSWEEAASYAYLMLASGLPWRSSRPAYYRKGAYWIAAYASMDLIPEIVMRLAAREVA